MDRRSDPGPADLSVTASPGAIRRRVLDRLLAVRSLWFASAADRRAWVSAGAPLYVLRERSDPDERPWPDEVPPIEVGPRLGSLWASCFAPALVGRYTVDGETTTVGWQVRWPRPTRLLVAGWWAVLLVWAAAIATGNTGEGDPTVFWAFLALTSTVGPWLGWQLGGRALQDAWPALRDAIEQPEVDEDW